jgi:hypothetical protein
MQFEYAVWDDKKRFSYDTSHLDCMKNGNGEQDSAPRYFFKIRLSRPSCTQLP